jgi:hypothetical protein
LPAADRPENVLPVNTLFASHPHLFLVRWHLGLKIVVLFVIDIHCGGDPQVCNVRHRIFVRHEQPLGKVEI